MALCNVQENKEDVEEEVEDAKEDKDDEEKDEDAVDTQIAELEVVKNTCVHFACTKKHKL